MEEKKNYVIGLDIGIGSVGWAVVNMDRPRIEDFGVRLFDSGEDTHSRERKSQQRRGFRAMRRVTRRRTHRIVRLKQLFERIGLVSSDALESYYTHLTAHPLELRVRALSDKLSPTELAAALLHIGKHRGYNEFYQLSEEEKKDLSKEEKEDRSRAEAYEKIAQSMPGKTPAEMYLSHPLFMSEYGVRYRNTNKQDESKKVLIPRTAIEAEARRICEKQAQFYPCLTEQNRKQIYTILFKQRDFEDGPGDPTDETRQYKGFLDTIGNCRFYPEEKRGARFSILGDLFVLVNRLSQNRYFDSETGEVKDSAAAFREIFETALLNGDSDFSSIKKILKKHGLDMLNTNEKSPSSPNQCLAFTRIIKPILEKNGCNWKDTIRSEFPFAAYREDSFLNKIGRIISENYTPQRRIKLLKEVGLSDGIAQAIAKKKTGGTTSVSNRYMKEAVEAFLQGELFGDYNARREKERQQQISVEKKHYKLPPFKEGEYVNNPVVFRSINETRKIVNAIIEKFGSPHAINIEIAADVSRTFDERDRMRRENEKNRIRTEQLKIEIAELLHTTEETSAVQVERCRLGEMQEWKCPYCDQPITKEIAIRPNDRTYEIDHIVPFSKILDNTLHNKVLVHHGCNQAKGQSTPLMYLDADSKKKADFIQWVNAAYSRKDKDNRISKRKREYLLQPDLNEALMQEWKTRNLNDTRYIAKYLVQYLNDNLLFRSDEKKNVYAVKGGITSQMRRVWLNKDTWGGDDKSKLRTETNLHHAVDAVVIANCMPGYVALAEEALRLQQIYREEGRRETEKWKAALNGAAERLQRYYRIPKANAETMLHNIKQIPSFIPNLREEVDIRFCDCGLKNESAYREKLRRFYADDLRFASQIRMPLVSYKPNRKFSGSILISEVAKKAEDVNENCLIKQIDENNYARLDDRQYYCLEVYRRIDGSTGLRGIKYSWLKKKGGKLLLMADNPDDYGSHEMYIFKGDYIRIQKKKKSGYESKFEGFYQSIKNINQRHLWFMDRISADKQIVSVANQDRFVKLDVSLLGDVGRKEIPCGKPFLSETMRS